MTLQTAAPARRDDDAQDTPGRLRGLVDPGAIAIAVVLVGLAAVAIVEVRIGLSYKDEGFLWYGVQRVMAGELPFLDFRSYDPGRYLWSAALQAVLGEGILALRATVWLFAAGGLVAGMLALRRVVRGIPGLIAAGAALVAWMFPRHKRYDCAWPLVGILAAVRMIERRDTASHVIAGVVVGLGAFLGRNHGLYLAVGMTAIVWFIAPPERWGFARGMGRLAAGVVLGYLPMLGLIAFADGYLGAFMAANLEFLEHGTTKAIPVPWPWRGGDVDTIALGLLFVIAPVLYLVTGARLLRRRRRLDDPYDRVMLAATAIGVPYLHHAFARAGPNHFFQAAAPLVVLAIAYAALAWQRDRRALAAVIGSLILGFTLLPARSWHLYTYARSPERFQPVDVDGDMLLLGRGTARQLRFFERVEALVGDDAVLVTSNHTTVYALMEKQAPIHDVYMVFTRNEQEQREIIEELDDQDVQWALLMEQRRLEGTHPLVFEHIRSGWEPVDVEGTPDSAGLYRRPADGA